MQIIGGKKWFRIERFYQLCKLLVVECELKLRGFTSDRRLLVKYITVLKEIAVRY